MSTKSQSGCSLCGTLGGGVKEITYGVFASFAAVLCMPKPVFRRHLAHARRYRSEDVQLDVPHTL